jgi:hypothetical protein
MLGGTGYSVSYNYISTMRMLPTSKSFAAWRGRNPAIIEREKMCDHGGERDIEMMHMIKRVIPRRDSASPCHER